MSLELFPRQDDFRIVTLDSDDVAAPQGLHTLEVAEPRAYTAPIALVEIERWLTDVPRPPQSYVAVEADDPWGKVLTMASLLHGSFASSTSRRSPAAAA